MDNWTEEEWCVWAEATKPGTYLLSKGEKVVMPPPSTPEEKARFQALMQTLRDKFGVNTDG